MITLVSATYTLDHLQEDGRRWVAEWMVASDGQRRDSRYLAEPDEDHQAHLDEVAAGWIDHLNRPPDPPEGDV